VYEIQESQAKKGGLSLLAISILCFLAYGLTVGILFSAILCIPSLIIFSCLSGADLKIGHILTLLVASVALTGLLMAGFSPGAWGFTQSTNSVAFTGAMNLAFWAIGMCYGLRFLCAAPH
jgi:hypothetical protein